VRFLTLYLRSRRVPLALAVAAGGTALMWTLWSITSDERDATSWLVIMTVLVLAAGFTHTLSSADDELERTAALPWPPRRAAHLIAALAVIVALVLATQATGARFGPPTVVVRDAAGLLGLIALGAAVAGPARSWFLPLIWTMAATMFPQPAPLLAAIATWQHQPPDSRPAAVTAAVLALAGLIAYTATGPARRAAASPA
jgi:hypothetical protein